VNYRHFLRRVVAPLSLLVVGFAALAIPPSKAEDQQGQPAVTPQRIEADWLHQDKMRGGSTAKPVSQGKATPEQDAAGAVNGVKNGQWGFHTENENQPWWQVDLRGSVPLDRIVLYNRCEKGVADRAARIMVLLSEDGKGFKQAYQHEGTVFYGHTDKKPLSVKLDSAKARYVRLQLPGKSYFHLDEVEIYATGDEANVALGKPATQSSTSPWSVLHGKAEKGVARTGPGAYKTAQVIERGLKLAESLRRLGTGVDGEEQVLNQIAEQLGKLPQDAPDDVQRKLYFRARRAVRKMALANPLLDFDTILFVKRAPGMFPHMSDQFYGWWSRPGGGIYRLDGFKTDSPRLQCLTENWPEGNFLRPDLSYDGKKVVFAYCKYYGHVSAVRDKVKKEELPEDCFYHIFEMNVDGSGVRQLTSGRYDDFDARYLPDGQIVFLSTRKGIALQCGKASAQATAEATLPDSYVRCGGGNHRPVAVFTLHTMDAEGGDLRAISAFENFEWTPSVAVDGRILYARWDYIDRFNGPFISLWSTNPDGTNPQLVYGNFTTKPQAVFEARSIPNSHKLVFTASAHHSITGGSLVLLDRNLGTEQERPLTRLTPEVPFPETEGWANTYYANPFPLSEEHFLVGWADRRLPGHTLFKVDDPNNPSNAMGIYLFDAFGNLNLLHRDDALSSSYPLPVRPRQKPPIMPDSVDWTRRQEGRFLLQDVYEGLDGIPRGSIERLRVVAVPPKVQPHMNNPRLGVSREDPGKFILGTVPVEEDGSAYFRVPSGLSVFFQALDRDGLAVQTMRSLTYVQPNQTLSCIGCHESRDSTPMVRKTPMAAAREPSRLTLGPEGSWPLRFDQLVQPVLDKHCVRCHRPKSDEEHASDFDLTPAKSYQNLMSFGGKDLEQLSFERPKSIVGDCPARKSKLLAMLCKDKGHYDVRLDGDSYDRLVTWMDTYSHILGSFSDEQERQLRQFRESLADMLQQ